MELFVNDTSIPSYNMDRIRNRMYIHRYWWFHIADELEMSYRIPTL